MDTNMTGAELNLNASDEDIKRFYADDISRRVKSQMRGNLRIHLAISLALSYIHEGSRVLDIGCGVGQAAEAFGKRAKKGKVWGVDIIPEYINYCRQNTTNVNYYCINLTKDINGIKDVIKESLDVVTMLDVIEHLSVEDASNLFAGLADMISPKGLVVLTYPSPEYQRDLYSKPEARIQPIDQVIEINYVIELAKLARCKVVYFSYVDVWQTNQYIHCVLAKDVHCMRASLGNQLKKASMKHKTLMMRRFLINRVKRFFR